MFLSLSQVSVRMWRAVIWIGAHKWFRVAIGQISLLVLAIALASVLALGMNSTAIEGEYRVTRQSTFEGFEFIIEPVSANNMCVPPSVHKRCACDEASDVDTEGRVYTPMTMQCVAGDGDGVIKLGQAPDTEEKGPQARIAVYEEFADGSTRYVVAWPEYLWWMWRANTLHHAAVASLIFLLGVSLIDVHSWHWKLARETAAQEYADQRIAFNRLKDAGAPWSKRVPAAIMILVRPAIFFVICALGLSGIVTGDYM